MERPARAKSRLWLIVPASIVGGVFGGFLLRKQARQLFRSGSLFNFACFWDCSFKTLSARG